MGLIKLGQGGRNTRQFYSTTARHLSRLMESKPPGPGTRQTTARRKKRALLSRREALAQFPIGTRVTRSYAARDRQVSRVGQVYDFFSPYWRVRFPDNDWEELTVSEMKKSVVKRGRPVG